MPKLIIDEQEIEVPTGTKVIDAAEKLGIVIPRFCYHPALGSVGACRVCAVKFLEGPIKGVQMSCMIDAGTAWWYRPRMKRPWISVNMLSNG